MIRPLGHNPAGPAGKLTLYMMPGAPSKGPKTPAPFPLAKLDGQHAVFERGGDDFPLRIIYRRSGDQLRVTLEGAPATRSSLSSSAVSRGKISADVGI